MSAQPSLFHELTPEERAGLAKIKAGLADTNLVAFAPCGCWTAVMVEDRDFASNAKRVAEFMRDVERGGGGWVARMTHEEWSALRNGVNGDKTWGCDHEPQWGGLVATHRDCPRCDKEVRVLKNGRLAAHKPWGAWSWSENCSQEPWPARTQGGAA